MSSAGNRASIERLPAGVDARLSYDARPYAVAFISGLRDGKTVRETGYRADPFEPPAWRAAWVRRESPSRAGSVTTS